MIKKIVKSARVSYGILGMTVTALLIFPQVVDSPYYISIITMASLYAIFAASWDIVAGYTGQLVLGQALFIGIGGYAVAMLGDSIGVPAAIFAGVLIAVLFALLVGFPCLKLSGPFLGLTTLVMPLILQRLAFTFREVTGGEYGITIQSSLTRTELYYISITIMALSVFLLVSIAHSRLGKVFLAIKENELGVVAAGNNIAVYKLVAFVISAILTAIAGGLLAIYLRHIGPGSFAMFTSMNIMIMGIVGGMGTIIGPMIGAFGLIFAGEYLRGLGQFNDLIYSVILIVAVMLFPAGLAGVIKKLTDVNWVRGRFRRHGTRAKDRSVEQEVRKAKCG
jgi:branched-chain amino acid transport system permease protein